MKAPLATTDINQEQVHFLLQLKQQTHQVQERLKVEIRHKLTLIKQISQLKKELATRPVEKQAEYASIEEEQTVTNSKDLP